MDTQPARGVLDFGGTNGGTTTLSHLSPIHRRHDSAPPESFKRIKTNLKANTEKSSGTEQIKQSLDQAISYVLNDRPLEWSYNKHYREVENLCRSKHMEISNLAQRLGDEIESYFHLNVAPMVSETLSISDLRTSITKYIDEYSCWERKLKVLSKLFLYLDRSYLLQHPRKQMIMVFGASLFVNECVNKTGIILLKHKSLLREVRVNEDPLDMKLVKTITSILIKLNFEGNIPLHNDLIGLVVDHYSLLKDDWLKDPETYIERALHKMSCEITYFKECGHSKQFLKELLLKLKWTLFFQNYSQVVHATLPYLILDENSEELDIIFDFSRTAEDQYGLDALASLLYEWGTLVISRLDAVIEDKKVDSKTLIPALVNVNNELRKIAVERLGKDEIFEFELRTSFNKAINRPGTSSLVVTSLCKFCDSYFRSSRKTPTTDMTFEEFQNDVLTVFKGISNKDIVINLYKKDLSRRLLLGKCTHMDHELTLVESFIQVTGDTDNSMELQKMFDDWQSSVDNYSQIGGLNNTDLKFHALVLEKKIWPDIPKRDTNIIVPDELGDVLNEFTSIYHNADDRRKNHVLDWTNYALHQLTIEANFNSGPKELVVNLLQAVVIMRFNKSERNTFKEIQEATNIEASSLKRIIISLTKFKILLKNGDSYIFNSDLQDNSQRIKIPLSKDKDIISASETNATDVIQKNRENEIKATIVRLMKEHQTLAYVSLLTKALEILNRSEQVSIQDLKKAIEKLIESEYISRKENDLLSYIP